MHPRNDADNNSNTKKNWERTREHGQTGGKEDNTVINKDRWENVMRHDHRGTEGRQVGRQAGTMLKGVRVFPWHTNSHTFTDVCCCNNI